MKKFVQKYEMTFGGGGRVQKTIQKYEMTFGRG